MSSNEFGHECSAFKYDDVIHVKGDDKYLANILTDDHYRKWFNQVRGQGKIFILNKGRTGNGGTTGFINYARRHCKGLIVSVPNRSIVISKENEYDDLCCVYGGAENIDKNRNIKICTWDKTDEVEGYNQFGFENIDITDWDVDARFWSGSLLVVDEYHKLIDDNNYRPVCAKIVKTILTTKSNVVLLSATPNYEFIEFLRSFSGKEVETYNVQYDDQDTHRSYIPLVWFERKEGYRTYDIVCSLIEKSRNMKKEYKEYPSKVGLAYNKLALFFNSVKDITNIVKDLPDSSDVEVLCSKTEAHETDVPCYSKEYNPEKQIHFMTKAYLTGMDIPKKDRFWRVAFIGGNDVHYKAFSNKEVKQGLGRFRGGYDTTAFFTNGKVKDKMGYGHMKSMIESLGKEIQRRKKYAGDAEYVKDHLDEIVQTNLDYLYYTSKVESMDGWDCSDAFEDMMAVYPEYTVVKSVLPKIKHYPRKRNISFKKYKEKRLMGVKVPYIHGAICERFIDKFGMGKFATITLNDIERLMKLSDSVGDVDIDKMSPKYKFDLLLGDGYYRGSRLMSVLDYLGEAPTKVDSEGNTICDYSRLEEKVRDVFGVFCIRQIGKESKLSSCLFLCISENTVFHGKNCEHTLIYKCVFSNSTEKHPNLIKVSKKISKPNKKTEAITDYLESTTLFSLLETPAFEKEKAFEIQKEIFSKILANPSLVSHFKDTPDSKVVFDRYKHHQTMISEFYKDTTIAKVKYHHKKEEMEKIDCLIVDIDDSITYYEFQELYGIYEYTAYPTISNTDGDNWTKFRVIIPLAQTLLIPNDSLNVLKTLRRMICKYEDKCHQLPSYINKEQWEMRRHNKGMVINISQHTVDYLDALLKNLKSYRGKFKKPKGTSKIERSEWWSMDKAIEYYHENDKDGERHWMTFVIKNNLSEEDCVEFERWLSSNHPEVLRKHWNTHKRIVA